MATNFSIVAWRIPWTEEPGRLQYMGVAKIRTWVRLHVFHICHKQEVGFKWWIGNFGKQQYREVNIPSTGKIMWGVCVCVWMCMGFHFIVILGFLLVKVLRLVWVGLKDKHFQDTVTIWMISGVNWSQVSKHCTVYVLPHISVLLCMSASFCVFLKTDFPCFPIYMTFQSSWIYFSFIKRLTELGLESLGLNSKCPTKYSFVHFA